MFGDTIHFRVPRKKWDEFREILVLNGAYIIELDRPLPPYKSKIVCIDAAPNPWNEVLVTDQCGRRDKIWAFKRETLELFLTIAALRHA